MLGKGSKPVSEIVADTLWIGGFKAPEKLPFKPDLWVHCAKEIRPNKKHAHRVVWLKLDDDEWDWRQHPDEVNTILHVVGEALEAIDAGRTVVITCHMGLNRSGLVTGLLMCTLGFTPGEVLGHLRSLRHPDVLCNADFEDLVVSVGDELAKLH
jgi:hypothetical protein